MHGGLGWDHTYLRRDLDPLSDVAQLIYYDHRGNGRSPRPANFDSLDHAVWAADADGLRQQLGHEQIVVFGHSYGGYLAQEYALRYPQHVAALALCATVPALDFADVIMANAAARATPEQFEAVVSGLSAPLASDDQLRDVFLRILPLYFHRFDAERDEGMFAQTRYSAQAFNRGFFGCLPHFNTVSQLSRITAPTLLLSGGDDWIAPVAQGADRLQAGIPHAETVVFQQSGHFPFAEEPERFRHALAAFIAGL